VKHTHTPHDDAELDEAVRQLLDLHRGQWQAVAEAADVSYSWLSKFSRRKITNPGFATLKRLHACLSGMPPPLPPLPSPPPLSAMAFEG
jgi:transcriptional regulator with XRE-family HTH domain